MTLNNNVLLIKHFVLKATVFQLVALFPFILLSVPILVYSFRPQQTCTAEGWVLIYYTADPTVTVITSFFKAVKILLYHSKWLQMLR